MAQKSPDGDVTDAHERYRLYVDESGDHVFRHLDKPGHRYLCLLGAFFRAGDYGRFHRSLEDLKQQHFPHSPDEPLVLHREDIINKRGPFWRLRTPALRARFDEDLLLLLGSAQFKIVAVVIDKMELQARYEVPAHPYHLALGFMLQRYCGYLNHVSRRGDVLAESRGGREDRLLKASYQWVRERGVFKQRGEFFRHALTSSELKLKPRSANIAGLQLADLLGHPVRQSILVGHGRIAGPVGSFAARLLAVVSGNLNRHLYDGRVDGYGTVLFPK